MSVLRSFACLLLLHCGFAAQGAVVYGLKSTNDGLTGSTSPTHLFRFGLSGSVVEDLGSLTLAGLDADFDGLAASQEFGLLAFQHTPAGSRLVDIDLLTATATLLAPPLFGREIRGATFGLSEQLWTVDVTENQLVLVSPTTGEELDAISLTLDSEAFDVPLATDLTVDFSGQLVLLASRDVYAVNQVSGEMTLLFTDTEGEPAPLSPVPPRIAGAVIGFSEEETLFAFDVEGAFTDDLYAYSLAGSFAREVLFAAPLSRIDAGLGDLALLLQPVDSGDYNRDGVVNAADYTVWRDTLGSTTVLTANGNDSGTSMSVINQADYQLWVNKFGSAAGSGADSATGIAVPEPTYWMLTMIAALAILARSFFRRL